MQVWGALTSLGSALPCGSLSSHKLPWVTGECGCCRSGAGTGQGLPWSSVPDPEPPAVSHHDPEIPFNHSFIEPPSAGWASDDSFSSDPESGEEDEGPAYCVPPQEGNQPLNSPRGPEQPCPLLLYSFSKRVSGAHSSAGHCCWLGDIVKSNTDSHPCQPSSVMGRNKTRVGPGDACFDGGRTRRGS